MKTDASTSTFCLISSFDRSAKAVTSAVIDAASGSFFDE